ncbi:dihydrodipicolinate reductase [Aquipseudomonas ullengensis]|uniref:Dihydrodipicolinate reductase n=1 Tax=Aquipseudomonas ullengensis TaxID=2759166 RepID=A0A7W4LQR3_9GAMM|nr:dihydrodipicolinate reductase [Pseudomonas ullengensis]MBB2497407.1 dihydrodipicolinate reductase [Pseudomonas ullengensis]
MTLRVIVCYTGGVGRELVRQLLHNPAFELVGVLVHSADKEGLDVGEIVGVDPVGLKATRDLAALTALRADVMSWHGLKWEPEVIARFLRAGTSVYSGIGGWYLPSQPEHQMLQEAAAQGGAALVAGGNIPGLISDVLPLFCSGYSSNIRMVRARQRNYIPHYPSAVQMGQYLGIGQPLPAAAFDPSAAPSEIDKLWMWGIAQSAALVAQGLGVAMDELRLTNKEFGASPADMVLQPSGLAVAKGTAAGVRWTFTAFTGGQPFYELINEQTVRLDIGAGWRDVEDAPNWRVVIEGSPTIQCELGLVADPAAPDHVAALNAARALNFLARIAAAAPGWRSVLDLPAPVGTLAARRPGL